MKLTSKFFNDNSFLSFFSFFSFTYTCFLYLLLFFIKLMLLTLTTSSLFSFFFLFSLSRKIPFLLLPSSSLASSASSHGFLDPNHPPSSLIIISILNPHFSFFPFEKELLVSVVQRLLLLFPFSSSSFSSSPSSSFSSLFYLHYTLDDPFLRRLVHHLFQVSSFFSPLSLNGFDMFVCMYHRFFYLVYSLFQCSHQASIFFLSLSVMIVFVLHLFHFFSFFLSFFNPLSSLTYSPPSFSSSSALVSLSASSSILLIFLSPSSYLPLGIPSLSIH